MFSVFRVKTRRFWGCGDGIAAVEFALILPLLITTFFGMIEVADAMTANRRVAIATNNAADLAAQSISLSPSEVAGLYQAVISTLEPADLTGVDMTLVSIILDGDDNPIVHWSSDKNGAEHEDYAPGDNFTELAGEFMTGSSGFVLNSGGSVIFAKIEYPYTTTFTHRFVDETIDFERNAIRIPRLIARIQFCDDNGNNCTG
ncbi:MAG: TadE/TadG family type IV pilus assembly protein [Pseudomonadota bacterium]